MRFDSASHHHWSLVSWPSGAYGHDTYTIVRVADLTRIMGKLAITLTGISAHFRCPRTEAVAPYCIVRAQADMHGDCNPGRWSRLDVEDADVAP